MNPDNLGYIVWSTLQNIILWSDPKELAVVLRSLADEVERGGTE